MKKNSLFLLVFMIFPLSILSQMLPVKNYNTKNGLAQNQITSIIQDEEGFLWFNTYGGVSKFNGQEFINYTVSNGLAENGVRSLFFFEDLEIFRAFNSFSIKIKDNLYAYGETYFLNRFGEQILYTNVNSDSVSFNLYACSKTTVYKFNHTNLSFEIYYDLTKIPEPINETNALFNFLDNGNFYISLENYSYLIDIEADKIINLNKTLGLPKNNEYLVQFLTIDDTMNHIIILRMKIGNGHSEFYDYDVKQNKAKLITSAKYLSFLYDFDDQGNAIYYQEEDDNAFWIFNEKGDVFSYNLTSGILQEPGFSFNLYKIDYTKIKENFFDGDVLWLATDEGLLKQDLKNNLRKMYTTRNGLSSNRIETVHQDREKNIWIGTNGSGIDMLTPGKIENYTSRHGLSHDAVGNIVQAVDLSYWFTTDYGVSHLNVDGTFEKYFIEDGLLTNDTWAIMEDSYGKIWVGTDRGGIYQFDNGKFKNMVPTGCGQSNSYITEIFKDRFGHLWIPRENYLIKYTHDKSYKYELEKDYSIYEIIEDDDGILWCAAGTDGLLKFNKKGEILNWIKPDHRIFSSTLVSLCEYDDRYLWCASYGEGIIVFDKQSESFEKKIIDEFKGSEIIKSVVKDDLNHIWVGTIDGIFEYKNGVFSKYSETDGLVANNTRSTGGYKDRMGNIWFASTFGAIKINPYIDNFDEIAPLVHFTSFISNKKQVINTDSLYVFDYNNNNVTFEFIGLDYRNPKMIRYSHILENFDENWTEESSENKIRYTNLDKGYYSFKIKATDRAGNESLIKQINFKILAPFWETLWFQFIVLSLIIFLVYLVFKWRLRILKRKNEELERIVAIRTQELKEKNDQILSSIRYSKRIQKAILPVQSNMKKAFKDMFIIYEPRDIIAGDFFWFAKFKSNILIASVDCTGHGVPGALMSMVGNMLLNEIVHQEGIREPGKILERLHDDVRRVLKQENSSHSMDGMDICLCNIVPSEKKLIFSGAGLPLFLVEKDSDKTILHHIRGERKTIGGKQKEEKRTFAEIEWFYKQDAMVYLTTDGFCDQSDPNDKKFGSRRLKKILQKIASLDSQKQKEILLTKLSEHKKEEEQRDDITVIGIRL